jgi:uncharacterized protein (DUF169 family)
MLLSGAAETQQRELEDTLQTMTGLDYVRPKEVAAIPVPDTQSKHAVYGPLGEFPSTPDLVLLFADAGQGLIVAEATARVDGRLSPAMGRPACAVVPQVLTSERAAQSLGCCGARAYLDALSDNVTLWALPGDGLADYCREIEMLAAANRTLTRFHQLRRNDVEAGRRPTVK